jgi:hypothetical protein
LFEEKRCLITNTLLSIELLPGSGHQSFRGGNTMSDPIYSNDGEKSTSDFITPNNITVCKSYSSRFVLCKTIYPTSEVAYDNVKYYNFFNRPVYHLQDLFELIKYLLARPQCCVIRGTAIDDNAVRQRRLFHDDRATGDRATIIEQNQNWFALDIDGYGVSSGDLKDDATRVLLALNLSGVEAFAIPSAGYLRKPGIHIRLFLWNSVKVSCIALKKHFAGAKDVVDTALFGPVQPIYTARPRFIGCSDPCSKWWTWIGGESQFTDIRHIITDNDSKQEYHPATFKQAIASKEKVIREMKYVDDGERHKWLYKHTVWIAKYCIAGLLDDDIIKDEFAAAAMMWWHGNAKNDRNTIEDAFKDAYNDAEGNRNGQF